VPIRFDINPPPPAQDPAKAGFYRSGDKETAEAAGIAAREFDLRRLATYLLLKIGSNTGFTEDS